MPKITKLLINTSDEDKMLDIMLLALAEHDVYDELPYLLNITSEDVVDEVWHPVPKKKTVFKARPGKSLVSVTNAFTLKWADGKDWWEAAAARCDKAGIPYEIIDVRYM